MEQHHYDSGTHTLKDGKIITSPLNKNNIATVKTNEILTKILLQVSVK